MPLLRARLVASLIILCLAQLPTTAHARGEWFEGLDLDSSLASSELVLIARVTEVSEQRIVHGGKGESVSRQYKFKPLRTLKGVFARDSLSLTSDDLGQWGSLDGPSSIVKDQFRLLILGRSNVGYVVERIGNNRVNPGPLTDEKDPIIPAIQTLLATLNEHDRARKVTLLLNSLPEAKGAGAVSLLTALDHRSILAAQLPGIIAAIKPHLISDSPAVRTAAATTLQKIFEADYLHHDDLRKEGVALLVASLDRPETILNPRLAFIDAIGFAGVIDPKATAALSLKPRPATLAESATRIAAASRLQLPDLRPPADDFLDELSLDTPHDIELRIETAETHDRPDTAPRLLRRLKQKLATGLNAYTELEALGECPRDVAAPALLEAYKLGLDSREQLFFCLAATTLADPRLVPTLSDILESGQSDSRSSVINALLKIDTDDAAKAAQPHLAGEMDLGRKLELAAFLGRHKIPDGYPYAIEHMSEPNLRDLAITALAAIHDPKTINEARAIWKTSNDINWSSAAIRALGAVGDKDSIPPILAIAQDAKSPLAGSALLALADMAAPEALPPLRVALASRKPETANAAARAAAKLLLLPNTKDDPARDQLAALLADADAEPYARSAALEALIAINDPRLPAALQAAARDATLERSNLLQRVETVIAEKKIALKLP